MASNFIYGVKSPEPPQNLRATYTEKLIDLSWDSVPGATGYNIYTSPESNTPGQMRRKVNPVLVISGPRFAYIWDVERKKKVRRIKGYKHFLSVTAVFSTKAGNIESDFSKELDNNYYTGFDNAISEEKIRSILIKKQTLEKLPIPLEESNAGKFIIFMKKIGKLTNQLISNSIDPLQIGGCAPVATIVVNLMKKSGIDAYKIEGHFIKEYHNFVVTNIDNVEYILDFAANQFIPDASPVLIPRDLCNINAKGRMADTGTPIYSVGKIFSADQTQLVEKEAADVYRTILDSVSKVIELKN